jgi:hypothetical protein
MADEAPSTLPRGRQTKFTVELAASLTAEIREGATRNNAASAVGVCVRTLQLWLAKGRQGEEPYVAFVTAVREAERSCLRAVEKAVFKYATQSGKDGMEYLARRSKIWVKRDRFELTGKNGQPVEVRQVSADDLIARVARIAKHNGVNGHATPAPEALSTDEATPTTQS